MTLSDILFSRSLAYCQHFHIGFFVHIRRRWQDFNW